LHPSLFSFEVEETINWIEEELGSDSFSDAFRKEKIGKMSCYQSNYHMAAGNLLRIDTSWAAWLTGHLNGHLFYFRRRVVVRIGRPSFEGGFQHHKTLSKKEDHQSGSQDETTSRSTH